MKYKEIAINYSNARYVLSQKGNPDENPLWLLLSQKDIFSSYCHSTFMLEFTSQHVLLILCET